MNRTISISTDVYAAIWAARRPGEENENAILERVLDCRAEASIPNVERREASSGTGFYDMRHDVHFDEGFEAFRTYKGKEYSAVATNGSWLRRDNGKKYASLNRLNDSIVAGAENVWNGNWKFRSIDGSIKSINSLRSRH